jgi:hypothetical protein
MTHLRLLGFSPAWPADEKCRPVPTLAVTVVPLEPPCDVNESSIVTAIYHRMMLL